MSGAMEDFKRAERKQRTRMSHRKSSISSTHTAIIGATSPNMVHASATATAAWKLKEREQEAFSRNFVDLTADSPQNGGTRLGVPAGTLSPELSFSPCYHHTSHRHRAAFERNRSYPEVSTEAEILIVDSEARQNVKPKKACASPRASRETREMVPLNLSKADGQRGSFHILKDTMTFSCAPSGENDNLRLAVSDPNGTDKKVSVASGVEFDVGRSSIQRRQLRWRQRRSSITDAGTSHQRFKPPRLVTPCNKSGMSYGDVERPIEIDSMEPSSSSAAVKDIAMVSPNRARQIEADELLAKLLQEDYGLEAEEGSLILDDAQLAWMLQEEENATYMQQRVESATQAVNESTLRAATDSEILRVLPTIRSQAARPAASSLRMRMLRDLHNRSHRRMTRGQSLGGHASNFLEQFLNFPEGLDLETRLELLGAMETGSEGSFAMLNQVDRDFNEGDYEMLLALDDRYRGHSGASHSRIEQLPISVIKPTDAYQETCSICLEIPVVDDVIRRLPCMHGFHLQCIDEWLTRQANCPVCKMEI